MFICILITGFQDGKCKFNAANVGATDTGYVDIKSKSEPDLQAAVATVGPVSVAIDASHSSFQLYRFELVEQVENNKPALAGKNPLNFPPID